MRVGRFIGKLGVVSLPAVQAGLNLDERVVRRHVARLEAAGWLGRVPWVWGEGSVVWLTGLGIECAGLGGVRPIKAPPSPTTTAHGVLVGWSAARAEKRGQVWKSARELAVDRERWAVRTRCERGYTTCLPGVAVWISNAKPPVAVVAESGHRREDRQRMILEGWRDALWAGRYTAVRYDCASASAATLITRLAKKVGLTSPDLYVAVQADADEIAALVPAADDAEASEPASQNGSSDADAPLTAELSSTGPNPAPPVPPPVRTAPAAPPAPEPETPEEAADRERRYREIFGIPEPKTRRRWRR